MQENNAIILIGIKHSGKTTLGRLLAADLSYDFIDIDSVITEVTGKTPRQIYSEKGPAFFMTAEETVCQKIAAAHKNRPVVISTGGGICDNAPALCILRPLGKFVFLQVPEKTAADRILNKAEKASDGTWKNLPAYIANEKPSDEEAVRKIFHKFYVERNDIYESIADVTVKTQNVSKDQNYQLLLKTLGINTNK